MEPENARLKIEHGTGVSFVRFEEISILEEGQIKQLEELIMPIVEEAGGEKIVLNFVNVQFMSSSMLGLLVKIHKRVAEKGGRLALINVAPKIYKVFQITNLTRVLDIS